MRQQFLPNKFKIISGSALKVIAVMTMIIDHIGAHLINREIVLLQIGGYELTLYRAMRDVGRLAFPIFCFLLIEGFLHTRNRKRYGISLFIFALVSEIPWNLEHTGTIFFKEQNVFFTLLLGYLGMCAIEYFKTRPIIQFLSLLGLAILSVVLKTDYSISGYCFIILLYMLREHEVMRIFTTSLLSNYRFVLLAFFLISMYNGKRGFIKGKFLKYAFYAIYPLHIFIIYLIKANLIGFE